MIVWTTKTAGTVWNSKKQLHYYHYYYIMPRAIYHFYIMHLIGSLLLMLELTLTTL
jgi:hypothetical protein